jgi:hypothetical protein
LFAPLRFHSCFRQHNEQGEEAIEMAKKPSGKAARKSPRTTKAKGGGQKKPAATKRARPATEKYEQPGAPWWKQHLPG